MTSSERAIHKPDSREFKHLCSLDTQRLLYRVGADLETNSQAYAMLGSVKRALGAWNAFAPPAGKIREWWASIPQGQPDQKSSDNQTDSKPR